MVLILGLIASTLLLIEVVAHNKTTKQLKTTEAQLNTYRSIARKAVMGDQ